MPEKQDMIHLSTLPVFEYRGQIVTNSRDVAALFNATQRATRRFCCRGMHRHYRDRKRRYSPTHGRKGRVKR